MKNGYFKVAAALPPLRVADPNYNTAELIQLTHRASDMGVSVLVFPELCITGSTCGDLFQNDTLLNAAKQSLVQYLKQTEALSVLSVVGLPLTVDGQLYNCAAVCLGGRLLGIVPKNEGDRCFAAGPQNVKAMTWGKETVPFGGELLFWNENAPALCVAVEIGDTMWRSAPLSVIYASSGATLLCRPTASYETVDIAEKRRLLLKAESQRLSVACVYASAGYGESTTDTVFGGHRLIVENGTALAEAVPFCTKDRLLISEIDAELLTREQRKRKQISETITEIAFSMPLRETTLTRPIDPHPFVPADPSELATRCETVLSIQAHGLAQRMERAYAKKAVLGISGGLDSTLALLVAHRAMKLMKRPATDIVAVTMPCFGTTGRTKSNAEILCRELRVDFRCVDIKRSVTQHFLDIDHDPEVHDVTYENCQARERTQVLMDIANDLGGMVIGTGDLSELALGWATYNGDHMSMYGVNGGVPKTMLRHIVKHCAVLAEAAGVQSLANALYDVLDTPVSPELLPADGNGNIAQKTEDLVGPYELHDFYIFHYLRYGFSPEKLYRIAKYALGDRYSEEVLLKWLNTFLRRFFAQQFKRSCLPDGPKIGSVGLSPRGDWQMPSDASSALWLAEAEKLK